MLSAEAYYCEIIHCRLLEWDHRAITADGRVLMATEARERCCAYADWIHENRHFLSDLVNQTWRTSNSWRHIHSTR
jgi:hypothetical protein